MGVASVRPRDGEDRTRGYRLGSLDSAREAFTAATKLPVEWDA